MSSNLIFMFSGQGSQYVGMGKELYDNYEAAKKVLDEADQIVDFDLKDMIFNGPEEDLNNTKNTQPAIYTVSAMVKAVLTENDIEPAAAAGHSLGEYSALYAAGVLSFADGLKLVRRRGELMDQADPEGKGTMAAVIGMADAEVEAVLAEIDGIVTVANYNSPGQVVISGEVEAVEAAGELLSEEGAKKVIPLTVSGAFHSPLMEPAKEELKSTIEAVEFKDAQIPFIANVTADYVKKSSEIKDALIKQLNNSVRWVETIERFKADGYEDYIEVGPGRVLKGLMRRIDRSLNAYNVEDEKSLNKTLKKLK
ncbi:MAG: [acyl-carrier-protein] S-malonyltransferase [Halanaerobium sp. 4-GBenrich]|mgnify:FL=1|jgi:[acyl-carrier-protein] S-malonyltransferase|uniref:Malonyl CoA-acyl carrier protein transacylase n=1 Tax=Halanaerobium congolense TaxID=54121 RepID=A0A1M7MAK2_9FIRM|nr:ACP S-malonyltransferase [Halanaerobium congolense]KXS49413.1 MAG: [acyl-carrier-protein] S-malonyltransferase [Halanaerobium sp. T82-1]ODS49755.1 MAG: [acyl-carrier-protein] S-malonyltransferase [Halanaerobium sp. 4-GBenrich]PUU90006.1 MAG: Malonyl CoA-acyl carrier protein transacylase [Halanaerobium sp.]PTX17525.1 [acyl-carrier-protein] S-malonyltransferase [Halanaerobium congolense]PXV62020.1 [acyl-carrier-protein] S-malonyltransferase [Halanaerobium congolense]